MGVGRGMKFLRTLGRRTLIVGGIVAIFGCPQATSSQLVQPPAAATEDAGGVLTSVSAMESVTAEVCSFQADWQRPSEDEQVKYLAADPRFAAAVDTEPLKTAADTFWQNDILSFTTYGLSARMEPMLLSGLWSAVDTVWASCYGDDQAVALNDGDLAETWLVDYRLVDVQWQGEQYIMTVEPAEGGLQVIHFDRLESNVVLPLQVIDVAGNEIEFVSGDYN
ncbi:MAG: hypothetical protein AAFU71_14085 [Cyanobacteria bacterium J06632_22]